MAAFVSEHGAVDALLSAVVDELSPNKEGVGISGAQDDMLAGADELAWPAAVLVVIFAVVSLIEFQARNIAVLCHVPKRFSHPPHPLASRAPR